MQKMRPALASTIGHCQTSPAQVDVGGRECMERMSLPLDHCVYLLTSIWPQLVMALHLLQGDQI